MEEHIKNPFNSEDIERLKKESEMIRLSPENKEFKEKEIIKRSIVSAFPLETDSSSSLEKETIPGAPDYLKNPSSEIKDKLVHLEEISRKKGINEAIKEASREDPFLLDAFHDYLAEKIIEEKALK